CIVVIDEIDAVGRARSRNAGFTSNDERENTLNQLLTEMDGFGTNSGVIVLAATNRADILDSALMRAGRFDRQIHVELPELKEREEIFKVHLRGIKVSPDFDIKMMAKHTPGFSGADIANVCNEAALTAARHSHSAVMQEDFLEAVDRIVGGLERKESTIMTPAEKRTTAYHEAGHALVGWLLPYADPVMKVSIIPRGNALGLTWYLPEERKNSSRSVIFDRMCALIAGRVAEEIINGEPSTGALNDLERMTKIAYAMVQYYGMSDKVGTLSFYDANGSRGYDITKPYSEKTAELMDKEVKDIIDKVHHRTKEIITSHKDGFVQMAELLLEKEVIFSEDVERILGPKVLPAVDERRVQEEEKPAEA
ncbi:MAG: AAA family ATPase, partial [Bacteroidales bacterium]|nr:AAA family ATPase [Bacteroidales bacterium]